jgi:hypothetical protein
VNKTDSPTPVVIPATSMRLQRSSSCCTRYKLGHSGRRQGNLHRVQKRSGPAGPCSIAVERRKALILAGCSRCSSCSISFFLKYW